MIDFPLPDRHAKRHKNLVRELLKGLHVCMCTHAAALPAGTQHPEGCSSTTATCGCIYTQQEMQRNILKIKIRSPLWDGTLWMLFAAPSLCFAWGLFCRCAREVWCFTYTVSYGQSCLGSGRGTTKGCNLCLDCAFCCVHLGSYAHFHLLGSCPIYLIFFFASLEIAESREFLLAALGRQHNLGAGAMCRQYVPSLFKA